MERHICNCSSLLQSLISAPLRKPRVDKLKNNYVIFDPELYKIEDDIEITIIGLNATWKITQHPAVAP
jgi:hypothetical protein